ncbi:xanthine dehydrogenase family protein molybdopterin-binding subunit [Oryzomonas rubra]|uniref:Xanthine dehydrogenase family protein molybdopterin-binding subunit n=1 Tax=Oryzomonas rubra TaxID=2509454 RepID=A0A5A9XKJ8_9BACT|nr:molybdopterin cofactor-binding domain-containing protein [Oryzomonas rubra]KAA0892061.1 xanthine dehydrogenase family protein molybdopterin-binding subunit [Oryzomonas rubra]
MTNVILVSRRVFLGTVFSAGAFVLCARLHPFQAVGALVADNPQAAWYPGVYLGIEPSGTVIIIAHRSEMGTGIRTALPMVAADELDADWSRVKIEQAIGDPKYGDQNTDGSKSIRDFYEALRDVGATGRLMLEHAAAATWKVAGSECRADHHRVVHLPSGRSLGFGELVAAAARQPVPAPGELRFKKPSEYRYVGTGVPIVDLAAICTGTAVFGYDTRLPGMLYASIERSPVLGGTLKSCDDREARKVKGVKKVVVMEPAKPPYAFQALGGVAVVADSTWAARQGRSKLKVQWEPGANGTYESENYRKSLQETARKPQKVVRNIGDVDAGFTRAVAIHEAEYYAPHLAHAAMEPPAAVANYKNGKVEAWVATQNPQAVQDAVAKALGIATKDVTCHVTLLGGGFGRKSKPDYAVEAAVLSKKVGKPVKVAWSREDDIQFDYYHSVAAMYLKAGTDGSGRPIAWLQRSVFPPIGSTFDASARYGGDNELGQGWVDVPFAIPNMRAENGPAQNHVRIGWLRSVANVYHAFAVQSFVDELAAEASRDRIEYFLDLLGPARIIDFGAEGTKFVNSGKPLDQYPLDTGRLRRVVEVVADRSGWGKGAPAKGRALGFAAHRSFLTYVAAVADLEVDNAGKIRIHRVDVAVDAGLVVHPERVKAQFEGAAVFAASIALMGEITAAGGQIQQSNFHDYPVARMGDAPLETRVHLIPSSERPTGVGEPGVPPVVAAICNAVFAATGKRIRHLPISKNKLA